VTNSRGAKAEKLRSLLAEIQESADSLYRPLLARRDDTDRIRSTLAVLKRFRFLFSLPGSIKKNIKEQQYDKVTHKYIIIMGLFGIELLIDWTLGVLMYR
jgi:exocyst complex component 2